MKPDEQPLGPGGRIVALAGFLAALLLLGFLRQRGILATSFWDHDSGLAGWAFALQLAALGAGVIALQVVPPRHARAVLIVEGALCVAAYGWPRAPAYLAGLLFFYAALELPLPHRLRRLLPVALILGLGFAAACGLVPTAGAYLFSMLFVVRLMVYAWEKWQNGWKPVALGDYLLYVLSAPLAVFPPYVVVVPFFRHHAAKMVPRLSARRARLAFRQLAAAILWTAALLGMGWLSGRFGLTEPSVPARYFRFVQDIVKVAALAHLVHGLLLMHGFEDRLPIDWPLLSRSYVEFWTRFQIHQKDLQVAFFYNPVMLRLRRANRYLAIIAACAVTLLIGNFALHFTARYVYLWPVFRQRLPALTIWYVASFLLLATSLCAQEWRVRHRRLPSSRVPWLSVRGVTDWLTTMLITGLLMSL